MKSVLFGALILTSSVAGASVCRVEKFSNGYFYATSNGQAVSGAYTKIEAAYDSMLELYRYRQCDSIANERHIPCTVKKYSNGYFYALKGETVYSGAYSDELKAAEAAKQVASLGLCHMKTSTSRCEIKKLSNGYIYVLVNGNVLSGAYTKFQDAFERSYSLDRAGLCVSERPRGDVTGRPARIGDDLNDSVDHQRDVENRRYENFKRVTLDMAEDIIQIVEDLESLANSDERVSVLMPIKKQAARLAARIEGGVDFKTVKNTLTHLEILLGDAVPFIDENLERDGNFHNAKRLLTYRETAKSLTSLMSDLGNNDDRVLY